MSKFQVTTVDLIDKTFDQKEAEVGDPVNAFLTTLEDIEPEELEGALNFYKERLKVNSNGGWIIDCEDGLILITELS